MRISRGRCVNRVGTQREYIHIWQQSEGQRKGGGAEHSGRNPRAFLVLANCLGRNRPHSQYLLEEDARSRNHPCCACFHSSLIPSLGCRKRKRCRRRKSRTTRTRSAIASTRRARRLIRNGSVCSSAARCPTTFAVLPFHRCYC